MFPAFRRTDVQHWRKWKFYPGALIWLWPRAFACFGSFCTCCLWIKLLLWNHDFRKPITGWRLRVKEFLYWWHMLVLMYAAWMPVYTEYVDYDYSEYLGPDYKKT